MRQHATAAALSNGTFQVVITWVDKDNRTLRSLPSINIPAQDLDHAFRMAEAINSGIVLSP